MSTNIALQNYIERISLAIVELELQTSVPPSNFKTCTLRVKMENHLFSINIFMLLFLVCGFKFLYSN